MNALTQEIGDFLYWLAIFEKKLEGCTQNHPGVEPDILFDFDLRDEAEQFIKNGTFLVRQWVEKKEFLDLIDMEIADNRAGVSIMDRSDDRVKRYTVEEGIFVNSPKEEHKVAELTRGLLETLTRFQMIRVELSKALLYLRKR